MQPAEIECLAQEMLLSDEEDMGDPMGPHDPFDNAELPSGYTYFGQLVAHDITDFKQVGKHLRNRRTSFLMLDTIYGDGVARDPCDPTKLAIGGRADHHRRPNSEYCVDDVRIPDFDLPRSKAGRADIADQSNDSHFLISQMQLALHLAHNRIADAAPSNETDRTYEYARRELTHHFQWVLLHDYLPRVVDSAGLMELEKGIASLLAGTGYSSWLDGVHPKIPAEFAFAVFRFGHSQVRGQYALNAVVSNVRLFKRIPRAPARKHLEGERNMPPNWQLDWRLFFDEGYRGQEPLPSGLQVQASRRIDDRIAHALGRMSSGERGKFSLPEVTLDVGNRMQLPTGQELCEHLGVKPVPELAGEETPLWLYILLEAKLTQGGARLGRLASRVVVETVLGLLAHEKRSYLHRSPQFVPTLGRGGKCTIHDLLAYGWPDPVTQLRCR